MSAFTSWIIMHAQYFALINLNLKLQLCAKAKPVLPPSNTPCSQLTRECYRRERKYLIENTIMLQPNISAHFWLQFYIFLIWSGFDQFPSLSLSAAGPPSSPVQRIETMAVITIFVKCWQLSPVINIQTRYHQIYSLKNYYCFLKWLLLDTFSLDDTLIGLVGQTLV